MENIFHSNIIKFSVYILTACDFAFAQNINQPVITNAVNAQLDLNQLDQLIKLSPTRPIYYCKRASWYVENNRFSEAIVDCDQAVLLNPQDPLAYFIRGAAHADLGDFQTALDDYNHVIELDPTNSSWTHAQRGVAYAKLGNYEKAIADYNDTIRLGATNQEIYNERAFAYGRTGEYAEAIADLSKSILFAPSAYAYASRGLAYSLIGNYSEGIRDCNKAVDLDPDNYEANNNLAWLLAVAPDPALRDGKNAVKYAKRACDRVGWNVPLCLGTLAAAYAETGDFDNAVKWENKSIELGLPKSETSKAQKMLRLFEDRKPFHEEKK